MPVAKLLLGMERDCVTDVPVPDAGYWVSAPVHLTMIYNTLHLPSRALCSYSSPSFPRFKNSYRYYKQPCMEHDLKLVFHPICASRGNECYYLLSVLGSVLGLAPCSGEEHKQCGTSSTQPHVKEMTYLFNASPMHRVLQGPQNEAAAQQPPENHLEPLTYQAVTFKKNLHIEDRLWLFSQELLPNLRSVWQPPC